MVAKCFYCKATNVEISHIKECAAKGKKTVATAVPALVAVAAPAPAVKAAPAHRAAMEKMKMQETPAPAEMITASEIASGMPWSYTPSAPVPAAAPATKVAPADMELGHYFKDGDAYKIVFNKAGTKKYAMKLYIQPTWGKAGKTLKGSWVYDSGAIYNLQPVDKMSKEQADNYAASTMEKYGIAFCCVCGKKLTAKESVTKGIGPVCSAKLGI